MTRDMATTWTPKELSELAGSIAEVGVRHMLGSVPMPPEAHVLLGFLRELYSKDGVLLGEAEERVAELIKRVESDREQRERLLAMRKQFCSARDKYELLARVFEEVSESLEGDYKPLAAAIAGLMRVLLAQCTPGWEQLPAEKKARVLAPLYMALHHLEAYRDTRRAYHAEAAETLALLALTRLDEVGQEEPTN